MLASVLATPALLAIPRSWKWWEYLKPFGLFHWVTVVAFLFAMRKLRRRGVALRGAPNADAFRRRLGWSVLVMQVVADVYQYRIADDIRTALPLQLCDFAAYGAAAWFLFRPRWLWVLMYFFGFGLCTQALVTPSVRAGFLHFTYWYYWGIHSMILLAAAWGLAVEGFRPTLRDVLFACGVLAVYTLVFMGVNELLDANYSFAGRTEPKFRTLISKLGPWPWRILQMYAMGVGMFFFLWGLYLFIAGRRARALVQGASSGSDDGTADGA